jgi:hypothetical protein
VNDGYAVLGDLNGDDYLDVVTTRYSSGGVTTLTAQLGPGLTGTSPSVQSTTPNNFRGGVLGDFNEDGIPDLASFHGYGGTWVALGVGNGGFVAPRQITGLWTDRLVVDDVNNDGHLDLVISDSQGTAIAVALGHGDGGFGAAIIHQVGATAQLAEFGVADVDKDGRADVIGTDQSGKVYFLRGHGDGTFDQFLLTTDAAAGTSVQLVLFDANRDGNVDVITTSTTGILVLLGDGSGNFVESGLPGLYQQYMATADIDRDGNLDVFGWNYNINAVQIYRGTGAGTFMPVVVYGNSATRVVLPGDLDHDGRIDFVSASRSLLYDRGCR